MARAAWLTMWLVLALAATARAELVNWAAYGHQYGGVDDTQREYTAQSVADCEDILSVWWAENVTYWCFRLDLQGEPELAYPGRYAICIDSKSGGASGDSNGSVPYGLTGIDYEVISPYNPSNDTWGPSGLYTWNGSSFDGSAIAPFNTEQDLGAAADSTQLEWRVPKSTVGRSFTFWGAVYSAGINPLYTMDIEITGGVTVPEPATLLFGRLTAIAALLCRRKRPA